MRVCQFLDGWNRTKMIHILMVVWDFLYDALMRICVAHVAK
jgi:hypothetical protein